MHNLGPFQTMSTMRQPAAGPGKAPTAINAGTTAACMACHFTKHAQEEAEGRSLAGELQCNAAPDHALAMRLFTNRWWLPPRQPYANVNLCDVYVGCSIAVGSNWETRDSRENAARCFHSRCFCSTPQLKSRSQHDAGDSSNTGSESPHALYSAHVHSASQHTNGLNHYCASSITLC